MKSFTLPDVKTLFGLSFLETQTLALSCKLEEGDEETKIPVTTLREYFKAKVKLHLAKAKLFESFVVECEDILRHPKEKEEDVEE